MGISFLYLYKIYIKNNGFIRRKNFIPLEIVEEISNWFKSFEYDFAELAQQEKGIT